MIYRVRVEILQDADSSDEASEIIMSLLDRASENDWRWNPEAWRVIDEPELVADEVPGASGQDRESYTDEQDRMSYTVSNEE